LARADLRALERGAGGRGTGQNAGLVAQEDLGIGADIDDEREVIGLIGFFGQATAAASAPTWPAMQGRR
jgi:hypothetical protein